MGEARQFLMSAKDVKGLKVLTAIRNGMDAGALRQMGDTLKGKLGDCVIILAGGKEKLSFVVMATDTAVKKGAHAGNIVKVAAQKTGGNGGGRDAQYADDRAGRNRKNHGGKADADDHAGDGSGGMY